MKTLKIKEMSCNHCVDRIHAALEAAEVKHSIDLETKTVTIDGCDHCVSKAIEEMSDIGFTAEL